MSHHHCPPEKSLTAYDFRGSVSLRFEDGSRATFKYALFERHGGLVHVYTEHCGYHSFLEASILEINGEEPGAES